MKKILIGSVFTSAIFFSGCASITGGEGDTNNNAFNGPSYSLADSNLVDGAIFNKKGATYTLLSNADIAGDITFGPNVKIIVKDPLTIDGKLTLLENTYVYFEEDAYLDVNEGELNILGSDSLPVHLKNNVPGKYWGYGSSQGYSGGIWFSSSANPLSKVRYAIVDSAKSGIMAGIDGVEITGSQFLNSQYYGINFDGSEIGPEAGFSGNSFAGNKVAPLSIHASMIGRLDANNAFDSTGKDIEVTSGDITEDGVWPAFAVAYHMTGAAEVKNSAGVVLEIAAGARFKFDQDAYMQVSNGGSLQVKGTADSMVYFGPAEHGKHWGYGSTEGFSGGLWLSDDAADNISLQYAIIDSAVTGVRVEVQGVTMNHCTFSNSEFTGATFVSSATPESFSNNAFVDNGTYSMSIGFGAVGSLDHSNTFSGDNSEIYLDNYTLSANATMPALPVAYFASTALQIQNSDKGVTLTIEPATTIHFSQDAYIDVGTNGTLIANGTATDPITFDAKVSGTQWGYGSTDTYSGGVWLSSDGTSNTTLSHVIFRDVVFGNAVWNDANVPSGQINISVE